MWGQTGKVRVYDLWRAPLSTALIYRAGQPCRALRLIILSWLTSNAREKSCPRANGKANSGGHNSTKRFGCSSVGFGGYRTRSFSSDRHVSHFLTTAHSHAFFLMIIIINKPGLKPPADGCHFLSRRLKKALLEAAKMEGVNVQMT